MNEQLLDDILVVDYAIGSIVKEATMEIKRDPVEDTEEYKAVAEEVESMAEALVDPNIRYGRNFFVEEEKKRLLKELYGIEWKTTDEMNPDWDFI